MKKIIALILTTIMAVTALVSCGGDGDSTAPDGMKLASGEAATYKLYVPEAWVIDLQTGATTAHASANDASNVSVMVWDLKHTDDTVESWWEINLETLKSSFTEYTEISTSDCKMGGYNAKDYVYTAKLGETVYQYRQAAAVKGGSVYVMTFTTTPDGYAAHSEAFESILANIKF